jgi:hypothetical protein
MVCDRGLDDLARAVERDLATPDLAPSTERAYAHDWADFVAFYTPHELLALPAAANPRALPEVPRDGLERGAQRLPPGAAGAKSLRRPDRSRSPDSAGARFYEDAFIDELIRRRAAYDNVLLLRLDPVRRIDD